MTTTRIPRIDKLKKDSAATIDILLRAARAQKEKDLKAAQSSMVNKYIGPKAAGVIYGFSENEIKGIAKQHPTAEYKSKSTLNIEDQLRLDRIEYLRTRAKLLAKVDSSWAANCLCLGQDYARAKAGFSEDEILAIERQARDDHENTLKDPSYLRRRGKELEKVDSSWTAYFFGRSYARNNAGFKFLEITAIEKQLATDKKAREAKSSLSIITNIPRNLFGDKEKKDNSITNQIKDRNAERLVQYLARKRGMG